MSLLEAVNQAIDDCIAADVLAEFLNAHRAEVLRVYLAEVNEEVLRKNLKAEGYDEGYDEGFTNHLACQISKKIAKGKSLEQIADELEEEVEDIRALYDELLSSAKGN